MFNEDLNNDTNTANSSKDSRLQLELDSGLNISNSDILSENSSVGEDSQLHGQSVNKGEKKAFKAAVDALKPGPAFRTCVGLYADRKFYIFASLHLAMSLVCFMHFGLQKFQSQTSTLPLEASFYSWKVGVPTFEFGTMHAILFQLAVLPLTMSRLLITLLSHTFLARFIPFSDMTRCHIAIGYVFASLLFITIIVFLIFFGVICNSGDQSFCKKFSTEIMITGYCIFISFMAVAFTSFFRHKIKYRVFYVVHHIVFVAYILTIMHTIDIVERKQGGRSQTFKWFGSSILLYAADRATMYLSHRYDSTIKSATTIDSEEKDGNLIIIKVKKPEMMSFSPGQYVYLKVPKVNNIWHPFSIASAPESDVLSFYIKVYSEKTWSGRLFKMLQRDLDKDHAEASFDQVDLNIPIEVLGPYGTALGDKRNYTHATVIGTGTGFVPCLSALEDHIHSCLLLDRCRYQTHSLRRKRYTNIEKSSPTSIGSHSHKKVFVTQAHHVMSILDKIEVAAELINQAVKTKMKINTHVLFMIAPSIGVFVLGLNLSWNHYSFELYKGMGVALMALTVVFQVLFVLSMCMQKEGCMYFRIIDIIFTCLNVVADWYWTSKRLWGNFRQIDTVLYSFIALIMILRLWGKSLRDVSYVKAKDLTTRSGPIIYEKLRFVWSCRSAELVAQVFPDISNLWDDLVQSWGEDEAKKKCEIYIHCTDPDEEKCKNLKEVIQNTNLYKTDCLKSERPDLLGVLEQNTMDILSSDYSRSKTLFAFCGSESIAKELKEAKVMSDLVVSMTGNAEHTTDLVVQTYGSPSAKKKKKTD